MNIKEHFLVGQRCSGRKQPGTVCPAGWDSMSMGMEVAVFLAYAFGMLVVYLLGRFLLVPLKWTLWCLASSLLGGLVIVVINTVFSSWGVLIPLNTITAVITGILGVPGLIMMTLFFL